MKKKEFYYPSADGRTQIHAVEWRPDGDPVCALQIVHGMRNMRTGMTPSPVIWRIGEFWLPETIIWAMEKAWEKIIPMATSAMKMRRMC